ncbi:MAG: RIP metalloprotease RseP [Alphaproteobacteria bacterium]|nr:RIP metalloprotease RseP [Alphaproteobacteria bacterium]
MNLIDMIQALGPNIAISIAAFLVAISILVFVHEWGHYIIARMCGVRVDEFSIGFGKEIWGRTDKAGTRWKISLIPLGGFVKMFGDTDPASAGVTDQIEEGEEPPRPMTEAEKQEAFFAKPVWQRAAIVFAGPAINYIFAVILLAGLFTFHGQKVVSPQIGGIIGGSAAERYGFQPHDIVISIDGKTVTKFQDITREMMVALDQEKHFVVKRGNALIDIYAKPTRKSEKDRFGFSSSRGVLGVFPSDSSVSVKNIRAVDGQSFGDKKDLIAVLNSKMGAVFTIDVGSDEDFDTYIIKPFANVNDTLGTHDNIIEETLTFASSKEEAVIPHNFMTATQSAIRETYVMTISTLEAIGQMIVGTRSATELGGIVRIGAIAGEMAQQGIIPFIILTALLSVNLGLINLLPIPLLDGGHLLFYFFETILGKPVPEQVQEYAFRAGFVFLIGIMAFANINDLIQISGILED